MRTNCKLAAGLLSLGLALAPMLSSNVRADDPPKDPPKEAPKGARVSMLEHFHQNVLKLDLTDAQKPKIEAAFDDAKPKVEAAMKDAAGDRAAVREKMKPIMDDLRKTIDGILTDDQKTKLEEMRKQGRGGQGGQKPPAA